MLSAATPPLIVPIYPAKRAKQFLHSSVSAWVAIALIGQWFFATYVFVYMYFQSLRATQSWLIRANP
jgi:hypothetical protein